MKIGIIIGRFQTDLPHYGHLQVLNHVKAVADKVVILIGCTPANITRKDPLDYNTRKVMMQKFCPEADIHPLHDKKYDETWSNQIDDLIAKHYADADVVLFGSRESFIGHYKGQFAIEEIKAEQPEHNASELRATIAQAPQNSMDFRSGVIYAAYNRFPISYQVVDIAVFDRRVIPYKILLGRKPNEQGWRLPGGFVDPTDDSLEAAATRELSEECGPILVNLMRYAASIRVEDWRYRGREDKIMTALFAANYLGGEAKAGDDLAEVGWFETDKLPVIVTEHKLLIDTLL